MLASTSWLFCSDSDEIPERVTYHIMSSVRKSNSSEGIEYVEDLQGKQRMSRPTDEPA